MKFELLVTGKTDDTNIQALIEAYTVRLRKYISFSVRVVPEPKKNKNRSVKEQKEQEGQLILSKLSASDRVYLLDEKGKEYRSVEFAGFIQKTMNSGGKKVVFVIGGPYGFSETVYKRADGKLSLSKMTFTHQMIRLFFAEQLYRAFSLLNNDPYHHE